MANQSALVVLRALLEGREIEYPAFGNVVLAETVDGGLRLALTATRAWVEAGENKSEPTLLGLELDLSTFVLDCQEMSAEQLHAIANAPIATLRRFKAR
jgi:hypothetical protein